MGRPNTMGLTRRDVARIKALAERVTDSFTPPALTDLVAPWRICAVRKGGNHGNGEVFGAWAGCDLVAFWRPGPDVDNVQAYLDGEKAAKAALRGAKAARDK